MSRRTNADIAKNLRAILADSNNETKDRLHAAELLIRMQAGQAKRPESKWKTGRNTAGLKQLLEASRAQNTEKPNANSLSVI